VPKPLYGAWRPELVTNPVEVPGDEITRHLERRGFLTTLTPDEELARFESIVDLLAAKSRQNQPVFIVMPTYGCNLRCGYCFQDHMRSDPRYAHLLQVMRPDMFDRILNAMDEIDRGDSTQRL